MGMTGQGRRGAGEVDEAAGEARSAAGGLPAALRLTVLSGVTGAAVAALVVGVILERVPVLVSGGGVLVLLILLAALGGRRSGREAPPAARIALARIEDLRATGGETADVPVKFRLTVAPGPEDGRSAYRVKISQSINLVDIPAYRPGGIAVVEYRPDQPWDVRIVTRPTPEWSRRAEGAQIDSAPESTLVSDPDAVGGAWCLLGLVALLAGAALVVLVFRGELFTSDDPPAASKPPSSSASRTFSTSTTVSGPSSSLLTFGRMRATAMELETRVGTAYVTAITIEDHRMAVRGDSALPPAETVHLQSLPYELLPGLVREARTTLGVRDPESWRIDVTPGTGGGVGPRVRVTVSGTEGTARLDADATGRVTDRRAVGETG
ncbi:hypothetical protein ACFC3O_25940 [Streptomyces sp. NPDC056007]|uniref:hypothetical protein n=1 Tax=Streptomyces sp. NPDC056007 TaxID=3345678 RepID=UPI0035DC5624